MAARHKRPGLAKTHAEPFARRREMELWQSSDYRLRELFERADVVSEGATRYEADGAVYYGSTSVLLQLASHGGGIPDDQLGQIAKIIAGDPHARVRAVRIACLEAQVRAEGPIGRVRAELFVRHDLRGVRLDVEVEAQVFESGRTKFRPRKTIPPKATPSQKARRGRKP